MPKVEVSSVPEKVGSSYPARYAEAMGPRGRRALGDAGGLTQFGVNLMRMPPGTQSSLAHWHEMQDEFVWIVSGELVLLLGDEEHVMQSGDCAAFPAGETVAHCFVNRSNAEAQLLVVGSRTSHEAGHYPGLDMIYREDADGVRFERLDGSLIKTT